MTAAPSRRTAAPVTSPPVRLATSTIHSHSSDTAMQAPPSAAQARPAKSASMRVSNQANAAKLKLPDTGHHADFPKRHQAQKAKYPAISASTAQT
jgi:hypothetical protein